MEFGHVTTVPNAGFGYVLRHGWVGVDLFFTISGFVITLSALHGHQKQGAGFRRSFAIHRLARIVPLYLLTGLVYLILVSPASLVPSWRAMVVHVGSHLLFIHNLSAVTHGSINGPSWSVALEMQFYLAILLLAPWLARATAWRVLLYAFVMAAAWRFATTWVLIPGQSNPVLQFIYATQLPGVIDEFALGIVLGLAVHRSGGTMPRWLAAGWVPCLGWLTLSLVLLTIAARIDQALFFWNERIMIVAWRPLLALGFTALLGAAISFPWASKPWLAPLRYLGDISYGIYLWHMLVLMSLLKGVPVLSGGWLGAYVLIGTTALAALTWHLLEKPNLYKYKDVRTALSRAKLVLQSTEEGRDGQIRVQDGVISGRTLPEGRVENETGGAHYAPFVLTAPADQFDLQPPQAGVKVVALHSGGRKLR